MRKIVIAGIGTDVGKTVVSAVVVKATGGEYWKPVQTGSESDSEAVQSLVPGVICHKESYNFKMPASPHEASAAEGVRIEAMKPPLHEGPLVIELAGGLMVPLRKDLLFLDWAKTLDAEWILVSRYYLGSINHTLLSWAALQGQKIKGLVFVGEENAASREVIVEMTGLPVLLELPYATVNPEQITKWAEQWT